MNLKMHYYVPFLALCVLSTGCNGGKTQEQKLTAGIDIANLDTTASLGNDFYQYACGGWMKAHPLTGEYSRFGSFDQLAENNREQLLIEGLAKESHEAGSIAQKVGDLYKIAIDSVKRNKDGFAPLKPYLDKISAVKSKAELPVLIAGLQESGAAPFFALYVGADDKNSAMNIVQTYQSGLSMGEKEYYLDNDDKTKAIREKYKIYVVNLFKLAGFDPAAAEKAMGQVLDIETRLAKASRSRVELRDPQANYNKLTYDELKKQYASYDWDAYFSTVGLKDLKEINIGQPAFVKEAVTIINSEPLDAQLAYLQWKLLDASASSLSDEFYAAQFDFYSKTMAGIQEMRPRWKRAVSAVDGMLGEAVGQMYVEKYFPAAAKERMLALVRNLQTALGERIRNVDWMSDETKAKAKEKLSAFIIKIGYPDKWRDYSALEIKDDSYFANVIRSNKFEYAYMLGKAGKPVDRTEWGMTPQTVNAYYNPTTNEICFPAGILQYPFFDMNADDAFNYGAIGVVIGHEMTHGFDDQGRQYDKDGNLKEWWTEEDAKRFNERAAVMVAHFDSIEVAPGVHANGKLTLGENIADYGGLQVAFQAFRSATAGKPLEEKEGLTPEQRFFLAYANVWAGNIRPEAILLRTKSDPHSLGKWRVNGALPQISAWYDAFHITEKDSLYLPEGKRVHIW